MHKKNFVPMTASVDLTKKAFFQFTLSIGLVPTTALILSSCALVELIFEPFNSHTTSGTGIPEPMHDTSSFLGSDLTDKRETLGANGPES